MRSPRCFVLAEAEHFDVIYLAQRDIDRQFVRERGIFHGVRNRVERMNVSDQRLLLMRHVSDIGISGKEAGGGRVWVGRVIRNDEVPL